MARRRRNPEIIAGIVNGDGTIGRGDGFSVVRNSIGNYTVTIQASGFRIMGVVVEALGGGATVANGAGAVPSERSFNVASFVSSTAASGDSAFSFIAVGVQQ